MFRGVNHLTLDAKGRMAMPSRYRERLAERCGGQMVTTVDPDHCLLLYPLPDWEEIERKLVRLPSLNPAARRLQRLLIGHATECELDGHGRILVPPPLREFAGLDRRVVLIGQGNKFELWDEGTWTERREAWLKEAEAEAAEALAPELASLSL
ncbi:MAG TPA: transcriptional regulator MraZ [Chromatiales bacterium]|nr:transcriptional regulator MraZ [Chromatiales bacterium]